MWLFWAFSAMGMSALHFLKKFFEMFFQFLHAVNFLKSCFDFKKRRDQPKFCIRAERVDVLQSVVVILKTANIMCGGLGVGFYNVFSQLYSQSVVNVWNRHKKTFVANKKPIKKRDSLNDRCKITSTFKKYYCCLQKKFSSVGSNGCKLCLWCFCFGLRLCLRSCRKRNLYLCHFWKSIKYAIPMMIGIAQ